MPFSLGAVEDAKKILKQSYPQISDFESRTGIDIVRKATPTKDPQKSYMWEVEFKSPVNDDGRYLKFYGKTSAIPASINEVIKRNYAGMEYAYSGKDASPRIFRVTFWDDEELYVYRFFSRWFDIMQRGVERHKVKPETYMMDITLRLKDNSDTLTTQAFVFRGAFPSEISETSLSYNESTEITFDVMFTFRDKVMV